MQFKKSNIGVIGIPEGNEYNGTEANVEELISQDFSKLMKEF